MENAKSKTKRAFFDRRSGQDRRKAYNIDYFLEGGLERRSITNGDRRDSSRDRRKDWIKISRWSSLNVEDDNADPDENKDSLETE